jgi:hypothetical protein
MTARRDVCPTCGRPFTAQERRLRKNHAISEGQKIAWLNPAVRERRTAAIKAAWDDPLARSLMRRRKEFGHE